MARASFDKKQQAIESRVREFIKNLPENPTERENAASQLVEELAITLEELKITDEELRRQNEDLRKTQTALESERQKYRDLFENAPDGYLVTDCSGRILEANRRMGEMLHVHPESLAGRSIAHFVSCGTGPMFTAKLQDLAQGEAVTEWEVSLQPIEGTVLPVLINVTPIPATADTPPGLRWVIRNIGKRKRAEKALRESEEKFRVALRSSPTAVFQQDLDLRYTWVYQPHPHFTPEGLLGRRDADVLNPRSAAPITALKQRVLAERKPLSEDVVVWLNGNPFYYTLSVEPLYDASGSLIGISGSSTDITERKRAEVALRESEEESRHIVEYAPTGIYEIDYTVPRFKRVNDAMCDILGYTREELLAKNPLDLLDPDSQVRFQVRIRKVLAGEPIDESVAFRVFTKDGRTIWAELNVKLQYTDGNLDGALVVAHDVTERKRAEVSLQEALERLSFAQKAAKTGFWDWDLGTGNLEWSPEFFVLFGLPPTAAASFETWLHVLYPDDREPAMDKITQAIEQRISLENEYRIVLPDGELRWIGALGGTTYDADGKPLRMAGICFDITERKQMEEARAADVAALTRMHDMSSRLLDRRGLQPLLQEIMETAIAIMKADKGTLQLVEGSSLHIVAASGHSQAFLDFFASAEQQASACGRAMIDRSRIIVPDVEASDLFAGTPSLSIFHEAGVRSIQSTPMVSRSGALLGILTTQWRAPFTPNEHDLWRLDLLARQAADMIEIAQAEASLRKNAEFLKRSNEDLERFAYVSSHDLQEPLRTMVSFTQLLERRYKGKLDADADEYIQYLVNGGKRMQHLVNDLLEFSRVNTKGMEFRPTDANVIVEDALTGLQTQTGADGVSITVDLLPTVLADANQLRQVFQNLISNAIKFRRPHTTPEIYITAQQQDGMVQFRVQDNGIGIEPQYFEKIFIIFQRLHGMDQYEGTGIGLAIVKRIVDRHGGRIWVESEPGEGSTFYFTIPAASLSE